MKMIIQNLYK